jgi:phytoene synthase
MQAIISKTHHSADSDMAACRDLLRHGSRTFLAASLFLPKSVRDPACALYAFCRIADDAVDEGLGGPDAVNHIRQRLSQLYAGRPFDHPADRALGEVVARFGIPRDLPDALVEGFAWDAQGIRYDNFDALVAYAVRVAGTVGVMMALLMGARDPAVLGAAMDLGIGMQLSNIARDVGEDARNGRIYLPLDWCAEEGIDPARLIAHPEMSPALGRVVARLLARAEDFYTSADQGISHLPGSCQPGIRAARLLYAEIGHLVARHNFDSISRRAIVPASRKAWLAVQAMMGGIAEATKLSGRILPQGAHLIDAVAAMPKSPVRHGAAAAIKRPWWDFEQRLLWVLDLFERLERREIEEHIQQEARSADAHAHRGRTLVAGAE